MARKKKVQSIKPFKAAVPEVKELPRKVVGVEKEQPLKLYSFPNVNGHRIAVYARNMQEAIAKAREGVSNK